MDDVRRITLRCAAAAGFIITQTLLCGAIAQDNKPPTISPCSEVARAAQRASQIRNLPLLRPINCIEVDKQEFQNLVREELLKDNPPARVRFEGTAARMLGTIPKHYDYDRCVASDYGGDVLAFYHPDRRAIVFPSWVATPAEVLIHETVHALQDQHFNLSKLRTAANVSSDRALALSALAEGDAVWVQEAYNAERDSEPLEGLDPQAVSPPIAGCGLPDMLRRQFEFPYDYGKLFVEQLKSSQGTALIDKAFRNPPQTTREILYPREFAAAKRIPVSTPKLSKPPPSLHARLVYTEVLGEYFIRSFIRALVSTEDGIRAGKGWRGDQLSLYELPESGAKILYWDSVWENEQEAAQFRAAFSNALQKIFSVRLEPNVPGVLFSTPEFNVVRLQQRGKQVSYAVAEVSLWKFLPAFNHAK